MLRIAIVEDDKSYARILIDYLGRYEKERHVPIQPRYFHDGEDIVAEYTSDYDLILLDIQMRFLNGLETARAIREKDRLVLIVFLTNAAQFSLEGYQVHAFDYLVKPVSYEVFASRLDLALGYLKERRSRSLLISTADGLRKIDAGTILYIESHGHVMQIHTKMGVLETHARMSDLEERLAGEPFFRCHKGYLVNLDYVEGLSEGDCLVGAQRVPLSRRKKQEFLEELARNL